MDSIFLQISLGGREVLLIVLESLLLQANATNSVLTHTVLGMVGLLWLMIRQVIYHRFAQLKMPPEKQRRHQPCRLK